MKDERLGDTTEVSETDAEAGPELETPAKADELMDEKAEINRLLDEGYSVKQIVELGFKRRTAYHYAKQRVKPEGTPVSSNGQMPQTTLLPAKLDGKQVIVPEYLIKHLSFIDGDKKQVAVDMVLIWEAARRSVMEDVMILQGLTTAQAQTTETQLRILREAKSESRDIAQAAAEEAAFRVGQQVQEAARQAATSGSPNPMASMVTQAIQPYFTQMVGRIFGMFSGVGQPTMMNQPSQPPQQSWFQGAPVVSTPSTEQVSQEEIKEVFGDE